MANFYNLLGFSLKLAPEALDWLRGTAAVLSWICQEGEDVSDLAPPDRTRSDVCHAAAFMSISAWAWAGVLYPTPECRRRLL